MPEGVLASLIAGVLAVIGSYVSNLALTIRKSREQAIKDAEREQEQKDKLDRIYEEQRQVKIRLDSHNGYAEKFAKNSEKLAVLAEKQEATNKAIERMQKDIDYLKSDRCKV